MSKNIVILPSKSILYLFYNTILRLTLHHISYFSHHNQYYSFIYSFFSLFLYFFSLPLRVSLCYQQPVSSSPPSLSLCYLATKPIPKSMLDPKSTQQNSSKPIPKSPKTNQKIITNPKPYQTKSTEPSTASNHLQPKLSHHRNTQIKHPPSTETPNQTTTNHRNTQPTPLLKHHTAATTATTIGTRNWKHQKPTTKTQITNCNHQPNYHRNSARHHHWNPNHNPPTQNLNPLPPKSQPTNTKSQPTTTQITTHWPTAAPQPRQSTATKSREREKRESHREEKRESQSEIREKREEREESESVWESEWECGE